MGVTINRDALIIFPKQPLIDWANALTEDEKIECPKLMDHDKGSVYLMPETNNYEEGIELLEDNFTFFFEEELYSWVTDEELWPKPLTWELFQEFFHFSIQSLVVDTLEDPLERDDF